MEKIDCTYRSKREKCLGCGGVGYTVGSMDVEVRSDYTWSTAEVN
jgi:hypothetical protein